MTAKPNTILVLGGGIFPDGTLTNLSKQRLDAAVVLHKKQAAPTITVLGSRKSTYLPNAIDFPEAGAVLRARYLEEQGIDPAHIQKIEDGKDTIGEVLACQQDFARHEIRHFILVTSTLHMKRAKWLFETILGADYTVVPHNVDCGGLLVAEEEADYLAATQNYFQFYPERIKNPLNWHAENPSLYQSFRDIHDRYHPPGKESEAYIGVNPLTVNP